MQPAMLFHLAPLDQQVDGEVMEAGVGSELGSAIEDGRANLDLCGFFVGCFVNHFMPSCLYSFEGIPLVRSVCVSFVATQLHALGHSCDCSVHIWLQVPDLRSTAWLTHTERLAILRRISRSCGPRTPPGRPGSDGAPCAPLSSRSNIPLASCLKREMFGHCVIRWAGGRD